MWRLRRRAYGIALGIGCLIHERQLWVSPWSDGALDGTGPFALRPNKRREPAAGQCSEPSSWWIGSVKASAVGTLLRATGFSFPFPAARSLRGRPPVSCSVPAARFPRAPARMPRGAIAVLAGASSGPGSAPNASLVLPQGSGGEAGGGKSPMALVQLGEVATSGCYHPNSGAIMPS